MNTGDFLRLHRSVYQKTWSVRIEEQYRHGKGVLLYLSRYLKGGPLNPSQIRQCDASGIEFSFKDHRDGRRKTMMLDPMALIRRLLQHVPAKGVHTVRYYGLYATACRDKRNHCRALRGDLSSLESSSSDTLKDEVDWLCRQCGDALRLRYRCHRRGQKGNSIKERQNRATTPHVQQVDETLIANALRFESSCYSSA